MSLRVAIQMDPLSSINPTGDTTYTLMLEAQARGHKLFYYQPDALSLSNGHVYAHAYPVNIHPEKERFYELGGRQKLHLRDDVDVVLMRQDPPFDMHYLTYTYMLERIQDDCLVINNPREVRNCPEKLFACEFPELMPPTLISASERELAQFREEYKDIILKPLYAHGGRDVFRLQPGDPNFAGIIELLLRQYHCPVIAQTFIPEIYETGDKRVILIDGEPAGALTRIPAKGGIRSNLVAGGIAQKTTLTEADKHICKTLGPELKRRGLILVGIDIIGGKLTEINVTSPTGLQSINTFTNTKLEARFWDVIEQKLKTSA